MSSAEPPRGRVRPMWVRIALWSFLSSTVRGVGYVLG